MELKRFFSNSKIENNGFVVLENEEHNHLKNVLRFKIKDKVIVVCNDNFDYVCEIEEINKNNSVLKVIEKQENKHNPKINVSVFQALVKNDNMNLIVQKLTELGVTKLIPFESTFSTSKIKEAKTDKWQKISNQSLKQCKRSLCMQVENPVKFSNILPMLKNYDCIIFANECEKTTSIKNINEKANNIALIVGSEGGFSEEEIKQLLNYDAISVTLGNRILRAETASIALTSVTMYKFGEW